MHDDGRYHPAMAAATTRFSSKSSRLANNKELACSAFVLNFMSAKSGSMPVAPHPVNFQGAYIIKPGFPG
jgi:hypothetical protein